ncbi:MAG: hypothetical protein P1V51_19830 [Deltaproteobacteria bacterium]|nr:hypothetical protein [Deltaproteobacteria bacterium]
MTITTPQGRTYEAGTPEEVLALLHRDAFLAEDDRDDWMKEVARRALRYKEVIVSTASPEAFLHSLAYWGFIAIIPSQGKVPGTTPTEEG